MPFVFDGRPIDFEKDDTILLALLRAGEYPTSGGCLCLGGDCPHCLVIVDGVAYVRACQTRARAGAVVERHPANGYPPLRMDNISTAEIPARHVHCDVVIIGQGEAGRAAKAEALAAGKYIETVDVNEGQEAVGIYEGPLVIARTAQGMVHLHAREEIIVATGAAEIQPMGPGNTLRGLVTARAAEKLHGAGIPLGRVVAIGTPPAGVPVIAVAQEVVRFEGESKISAVIVLEGESEKRLECDTVAVGLGWHPRDALARMGNGLAVRVVGSAARPSDIPPCPTSGMVCHCAGVTAEDLETIWGRGFRELELVKRATLSGTGTCQGSVCLPYIRSFLKTRGEELQAPFTARPVTRQLTMAEAAAGAYHRFTLRTGLDAEHRRMGARMDRVGGWWRPWTYGKPLEEYWAVRQAVSIGDVSTLGKLLVDGPDALEFLERLYPTKVASIAPGHSRYVLLLDERGYVLDDGLILRDSATRFALTFTSGGASFAEMWLRDWAETWGLDVRLMYQTLSLGAINVTGPLTHELLARAGFVTPLKYMQHTQAAVAEVPCRVMRLSFTGELSYELHHSSEHSPKLWRRLLELGADLGVKPLGIDMLLKLRLEKGHIIVGQDSDFDSTPRRVNMEWAVKLDKEFVGKHAVVRTNKVPLDKQLVGFEMDGPAPLEGATIYYQNEYAGYVTSSFASPVLGKSVLLGWLKLFGGQLPAEAVIEGRVARRVATPFYDKESRRARA